MNRLSLRDYWVKFKSLGELRTIFRGMYGIYLKFVKEAQKMSMCDRLELGTLGSYAQQRRPIYWPSVCLQKKEKKKEEGRKELVSLMRLTMPRSRFDGNSRG
jgi:hypothetical protein